MKKDFLLRAGSKSFCLLEEPNSALMTLWPEDIATKQVPSNTRVLIMKRLWLGKEHMLALEEQSRASMFAKKRDMALTLDRDGFVVEVGLFGDRGVLLESDDSERQSSFLMLNHVCGWIQSMSGSKRVVSVLPPPARAVEKSHLYGDYVLDIPGV